MGWRACRGVLTGCGCRRTERLAQLKAQGGADRSGLDVVVLTSTCIRTFLRSPSQRRDVARRSSSADSRVTIYARALAATPTTPTSHCSSTAPPVAILPTGMNESAGFCELAESRPHSEKASRSAAAYDGQRCW